MLDNLQNRETHKFGNIREKKDEDLANPAQKHQSEYFENRDFSNLKSKPHVSSRDYDYLNGENSRNAKMKNLFQESAPWLNTRNVGTNSMLNYLTNMAVSNQQTWPQNVGKQVITNLATSALSNQQSDSKDVGKQALANFATSALSNQQSNSKDAGKQALTNMAVSALKNGISPREENKAYEDTQLNPMFSEWNTRRQANKYLDKKRFEDVPLIPNRMPQSEEPSEVKYNINLRDSNNGLENTIADSENNKYQKHTPYKKNTENIPTLMFTPITPQHYIHSVPENDDNKNIQNRMASNQPEENNETNMKDKDFKPSKLPETFIKILKNIRDTESSTPQEIPVISSKIPFSQTNNSKRNSESNSTKSFGYLESTSSNPDNNTEQDSNVIDLKIYGDFANSETRHKKEVSSEKNAGKSESHDLTLRTVVLVLSGIALLTLVIVFGTCFVYQRTIRRNSKEHKKRDSMSPIAKLATENGWYTMVCPKHPSSTINFNSIPPEDELVIAPKHHRSNGDVPALIGKTGVKSTSMPVLRQSETKHNSSSLYSSTSAEGSAFTPCRSGGLTKLPSLPTISSSSNADDSGN